MHPLNLHPPFWKSSPLFCHRTLDTPWGKIHYIIGGAGPNLILLHGNRGSHRDFSAQLPLLSRHFTVYALDTRGHGYSASSNTPMTIYSLAIELHYIVKQLHIKDFSIVGFSDGGNIALQYAALWPHDLQALVVSGVNLSPSGLRFPIALLYGLWLKTARLFRPLCPSLSRLDQTLSLITQDSKITFSALNHIDLPILLLIGQRDIITLAHTMKILRTLPSFLFTVSSFFFQMIGFLCLFAYSSFAIPWSILNWVALGALISLAFISTALFSPKMAFRETRHWMILFYFVLILLAILLKPWFAQYLVLMDMKLPLFLTGALTAISYFLSQCNYKRLAKGRENLISDLLISSHSLDSKE